MRTTATIEQAKITPKVLREMSVKIKLKLASESQPAEVQDFFYHQDVITIGRDSSNILQLPDLQRKQVSRFHARIERNGGSCQITDLNSRNRTFLNDQTLEPGRPYDLQEGDRIKIGNFILQFWTLVIEDGATAEPEAAELNPFLNEANDLIRSFGRLAQKYAGASPGGRRAKLQEILDIRLQEWMASEAGGIMAEALGWPSNVDTPAAPAELVPDEVMAKLLALQSENQALQQENQRLQSVAHQPASAMATTISTPVIEPQAPRARRALGLLLEMMVNLIRLRFEFENKFALRTIYQDADFLKLLRSSSDELQSLILDPGTPEAKVNERLALLKQEGERMIAHHQALLEGYNYAVEKGARQLLSHMDPVALRQKLASNEWRLGPLMIPWRLVPIFFQWKIWQSYRAKHDELRMEDRGIIEQRVFHSLFMQAYDRRMDAIPERLKTD